MQKVDLPVGVLLAQFISIEMRNSNYIEKVGSSFQNMEVIDSKIPQDVTKSIQSTIDYLFTLQDKSTTVIGQYKNQLLYADNIEPILCHASLEFIVQHLFLNTIDYSKIGLDENNVAELYHYYLHILYTGNSQRFENNLNLFFLSFKNKSITMDCAKIIERMVSRSTFKTFIENNRVVEFELDLFLYDARDTLKHLTQSV